MQSLDCQIDGNDCTPSRLIETLNVGDNDWHDNSVIARWCVRLPSTSQAFTNRTFTIDQGSNNGGFV